MARTKIDINVADVERLAGLGLTQAEICTSLGISERTLYRRKRDMAVVADAIKRGQAKTAETVSNWLFELCKKRNLGAIIWFEKTRRGLSERVDMTIRDWREEARQHGVDDVDELFDKLVSTAMDRARQGRSMAGSAEAAESGQSDNTES